MNATVGDLAACRAHRRSPNARQAGADLVVTPELALCGYPPEDLLLRGIFRGCGAPWPTGGPHKGITLMSANRARQTASATTPRR